jgi:AraC-like DNA-binding protein
LIVTRRSDRILGSWTLTESRPQHLRGLVESIWHFEGTVSHDRERHLPHGFLELVVTPGGCFYFVKDGTRQRCAPAAFAGLQTRPTFIEASSRRSCVLGVRLHPAGAYAVIGRRLPETSGQLVALGDLVGPAASELAGRCADARDAEARLRCAARWISGRIAQSPGADPRIGWAAARIEESHGLVAIGRLQEETGLPRKRFIVTFCEQVGLRPKLYARLVRFRRALRLLHEGGTSLAEIALAAGYYDQPHMNRDFRELGGIAPADLRGVNRFSPTTALG